MNVLRDALGHSTLATTDRYLRDVAPVHVIETMRRPRVGGGSLVAPWLPLSRSRASGGAAPMAAARFGTILLRFPLGATE